MRTRIVIDERERKSGIPNLLRKAGTDIDFAQLIVGDYIVSSEIAIERKTVYDLLSSIHDGRLFVQCSQLNEHYVRPVIIVEGDILDRHDRCEEGISSRTDVEMIDPKSKEGLERYVNLRGLDLDRKGERERGEVRVIDEANPNLEKSNLGLRKLRPLSEWSTLLYDALARVVLDFRIPIIPTPSAEYTARLLVVIANKVLLGGRPTGPLLRKIKKTNPMYFQQLSVLSSLPGVGEIIAERLLERFQSPTRALTASAAELARISGFGTERAARMRNILDTVTSRNHRNANQALEGNNLLEKKGTLQRTLLDEYDDNG